MDAELDVQGSAYPTDPAVNPPASPQPSDTPAPFTPEQLARIQLAVAANRQTHNANVASGGPGLFTRIGEGAAAVARDIGGGLMEAVPAAGRGVVKAVDAAASGLEALVGDTAVGRALMGAAEAVGINSSAEPVADLMFNEPETVTGSLISGLSQFAIGYGAASGALRILGAGTRGLGYAAGAGQIGERVSAAYGIGRAMVAGAGADAGFFAAHEERLSNLVQQFPALQNPVTEYLAANPDDSEAEGRFKNALEGLGVGAAVEGVLRAFRAVALRRAGRSTEAEAVAEGIERPPSPEDILRSDRNVQSAAPSRGAGEASIQLPEMEVRAEPAPRIVRLTDADVAQLELRVSAEDGFGQGRNISGIRLDTIESGEDMASLMSGLRVQYQDAFARQIGGDENGVRSLAQTRENADRLARELAADPELLWQRMVSVNGISHNLDAEVTMYRDLLATSGQRLRELAEVAHDPLGRVPDGFASRAEAMNEFRRQWERHANIVLAFKGIQTGMARALNAMRLPASASDSLRFSGDAMFEMGEEGIRRMAARVLATSEVADLTRVTRGGWGRNALDAVNEYWMNSLLSGLKTHVVNVASGALNTLVSPTERLIAGALRSGSPEGRQEFVEGALQFYGLASSVKDAFVMAGRALRIGDTILDPGRSPVEMRSAITARRLGTEDPVTAMLADGIGVAVRLPSRMLMGEDEFFKQLNYRARVRAEALRDGWAQGLRGDALSQHVDRALEGSFDATGRATNDLHLRAAREVTFTDDLSAQTWGGGRTIGETMEDMAGNHPAMRFIVPFIRTPTNIARWSWNRTPGLNLLRAQFTNDLMGKNGPEARGQAMAMMTTGAGLWTAAGVFALDGSITGGGPSDRDARRAMEATGWRPYSYRVENDDGSVEYRQFSRLDPFANFFGIAADLADVAGFQDSRELEQIAVDATTALARQLQNKTYLSGLTRAVAALADPSQRLGGAVNSLGGSFVPTLFGQQFNDDPNMREVRGIVDAMRARTPGYSERLDPQRNVLGEPVRVASAWGPDFLSPIATSTDQAANGPINTPEWRATVQSDVPNEIARQLSIHGSSIRPPPRKQGAVDLANLPSITGRSAYDRWQELTGTVELGGRNLRQRLEETIRSPEYLRTRTDGDFDHDGSRVAAIRSVISSYRTAAMAQLRRESPAIDALLRNEQQRSLRSRIQRGE